MLRMVTELRQHMPDVSLAKPMEVYVVHDISLLQIMIRGDMAGPRVQGFLSKWSKSISEMQNDQSSRRISSSVIEALG